ncbi:MAG: DciA family protein [Edaphobacter sp.]
MRDLLRNSLRHSLQTIGEEDRLATAWPVACGKAMATRGTVVGYADGVVLIEVVDAGWLRQMMSIQGQLAGEMGRIAGVTVRGIHFKVKNQNRGMTRDD